MDPVDTTNNVERPVVEVDLRAVQEFFNLDIELQAEALVGYQKPFGPSVKSK